LRWRSKESDFPAVIVLVTDGLAMEARGHFVQQRRDVLSSLGAAREGSRPKKDSLNAEPKWREAQEALL
jgi:hypothetical protein